MTAGVSGWTVRTCGVKAEGVEGCCCAKAVCRVEAESSTSRNALIKGQNVHVACARWRGVCCAKRRRFLNISFWGSRSRPEAGLQKILGCLSTVF
jgi:hypothetical protein